MNRLLLQHTVIKIPKNLTRGEAVDSNNRPNRRRRSWRCCIEDYWTADVSLLHLHITSGVTFLD
jgi:hypothetical protein